VALTPGISLAHAFCADRNAGAVVLMSDGMFGKRPPGAGSGKFDTPCERRHRTYSSAWSVAALAGVPLDAPPHAARPSAPPITVAISASRRFSMILRFTAHVVRGERQQQPNGGRYLAVT
jgi:hypothetical protein